MRISFRGILSATVALEAVKQDGYALQYVKDQTEAVALEAVKQDGRALQYVKDQTEAVALEAVKRNGYALQYVVNVKLFIKIAAMLGIKTAGVPDEVET